MSASSAKLADFFGFIFSLGNGNGGTDEAGWLERGINIRCWVKIQLSRADLRGWTL